MVNTRGRVHTRDVPTHIKLEAYMKKRTSKIIGMILSFILLTACAVGVIAAADTATDQVDLPALRVTEKNVEYNELMHLAINIDYDGDTGIYVYAEDATVGKDEPIHKSFAEKSDPNGKIYYATQGISARDIDTTYKIVPVLREGESVKFGTALNYSIAEYCNERLTEDDITNAQRNLYNRVLEYGEAADEIFGDEPSTAWKASAEVMSAKGGADGIVAIIHDDGTIDTVYALDEMFLEYGLVGNIAMLGNRVQGNASAVALWREVLDTERWKITSHSMTHTWWGIATENADGGYTFSDNEAKVIDEIVNSQKLLRELFPDQRVLTFAFPGFATEKKAYAGAYSGPIGSDVYNKIREFIYSPESRALIAETYIGARYDSTLKGNEAYVDEPFDFYYSNGGFISTSSYSSGAVAKTLADAAKGGFHTLSLHTSTATGGDITHAAMESVCKMLSDYVNEGVIWNAYYEDAILYMREAQTSTLTVNGDKNAVTILLTDEMDDEIYNYPLTVRIDAHKDWQAVKIVQGDSVSYAVAKSVDGKWIVDAEIVPDGGEATVTPVDPSEVPDEPEKTPKPSPKPITKIDATESFDGVTQNYVFSTSKPDVSKGEANIVAPEGYAGGKMLEMVKGATGVNDYWKIAVQKNAVTAEAMIFSFKYALDEAKSSGMIQQIYFSSSSTTPYFLAVYAQGGGYYIGDINSNNGVTVSNKLTGTLEYGKVYDIKVEICITGGKFLATTYVDGTKVFESENYANYTKAEGAVPKTTVSHVEIASLQSSLFTARIDDVVLKAGTYTEVGLTPIPVEEEGGGDGEEEIETVPPVLDTTYTFNNGTEGITSTSKTTYTSVAPTAGASPALCAEKTVSGYEYISFKTASTAVTAKKFVLDLDLNIASAYSGLVTQIAFNSTLASTPYDFTITGKSNGFVFGDLSNSSGGVPSTYGTTVFEYEKTYHVRLTVIPGDKDSFVATLEVDGTKIGESSNYYKVNGTTNDPYTTVNGVYFHWLSSATFKLYVDNLRLRVYDKLEEESQDKEGYLGFTDASDKNGVSGNAFTIADGKLTSTAVSAWSGLAFTRDSYTTTDTFTNGTKYIFEADFTYVSGTLPTDTSGIAFIGFLHGASYKNTYMLRESGQYIKYPGVDADGDGIQDYVTIYGSKFNAGTTYNVKFVSEVGSSTFLVYIDGVLVSTQTHNASTSSSMQVTTDNNLYGFGIYYRKDTQSGGFKCTFDNVKVSYEGTLIEKQYGIELSDGTIVDPNYFPGFVRKSVTFTIDDGDMTNDPLFINIVKPAGIKGTFNLCGLKDGMLSLYEGYEVANHHILHTTPMRDGFDYSGVEFVDGYLPPADEQDYGKIYIKAQTVDGKRVEGLYYVHYTLYGSTAGWHPLATDETYIEYLEWTTDSIDEMFGEDSCVGFAYPHGALSETIKKYIEEAGYLYARKTGNLKATTNFAMPADRFAWTYNADVSCMLDVMAQYDAYGNDGELKFFAFGVHAKDFVGKWDVLETFAELYGNRPDEFWYATNREIFEYEDAVKALEISDEKIVNSSDIDLYVKINGEEVIIEANSEYIFK